MLEVIRDLGLELEIIFNKGSVMVLPAGINKASGLIEAVRSLGLSPHNVVGVGDAENDHAFLRCCGCAVAVANALPSLKEAANAVMKGERGEGVIELVERLRHAETSLIPPERHAIPVGKDRDGKEYFIVPQNGSVLIAGSSRIGKSTLATALTEKMSAKKFEFCVFDPEGDYLELENAVPAGSPKIPPNLEEVMKLLGKLGANTVVNTQAMEIAERPGFFATLFPQIESVRARTGRPHWLLIDEAHHLLPASRGGMEEVLPEKLDAAVFITVYPDAVAPEALRMVKTVVALGPHAKEIIETFCKTVGVEPPRELPQPREKEVLVYSVNGEAFTINPERPEQQHRRHIRKYAVGDLGPERSFYFRGPENALHLRAQNLMMFLQIAEGVDDRTWEFHRQRGDYSKWFRNAIKNGELADEAEKIEQDGQLGPKESRERIKDEVLRRYTAPAQPDGA
ncbi:MAG: HAD hydrolase family protein [Rhodomicrobium sp.]